MSAVACKCFSYLHCWVVVTAFLATYMLLEIEVVVVIVNAWDAMSTTSLLLTWQKSFLAFSFKGFNSEKSRNNFVERLRRKKLNSIRKKFEIKDIWIFLLNFCAHY